MELRDAVSRVILKTADPPAEIEEELEEMVKPVEGETENAGASTSPERSIILPLFFSLVLSRLIPQSVALNLLSYAGWVGIVMNSFNALPLGYLDGGLIFSSISPNYSRVLSYASIVALIGLSFVYASWFILVIFALLIGLQGPSALYSLRGLSRKNKAIILLVLFFIIGGIVPIPFHISPSNFSMSPYQNRKWTLSNAVPEIH